MVSARENAELPVGEQSCGLIPDLCQLLPALPSGCILAGTFPEGDLVTCKRGDASGAACKAHSETNICLGRSPYLQADTIKGLSLSWFGTACLSRQ